jgi:hypothetical protein
MPRHVKQNLIKLNRTPLAVIPGNARDLLFRATKEKADSSGQEAALGMTIVDFFADRSLLSLGL